MASSKISPIFPFCFVILVSAVGHREITRGVIGDQKTGAEIILQGGDSGRRAGAQKSFAEEMPSDPK
jgi:hypothetical protein